jgi:hypothetical protein
MSSSSFYCLCDLNAFSDHVFRDVLPNLLAEYLEENRRADWTVADQVINAPKIVA